jgi:hypothetical protein
VEKMGRLVVIVQLREGAQGEALALLRGGPPFELHIDALDRYAAFLSTREAVLLLEGSGVNEDTVPWGEFSRWRDGSAWKRCAEGAPRLGELMDSSERPPNLTGVFFGPLPGPGDSEGGDTAGGT